MARKKWRAKNFNCLDYPTKTRGGQATKHRDPLIRERSRIPNDQQEKFGTTTTIERSPIFRISQLFGVIQSLNISTTKNKAGKIFKANSILCAPLRQKIENYFRECGSLLIFENEYSNRKIFHFNFSARGKCFH